MRSPILAVHLHYEQPSPVSTEVDIRLLAGTESLTHLSCEADIEDRVRYLFVRRFREIDRSTADLPVHALVQICFVGHRLNPAQVERLR